LVEAQRLLTAWLEGHPGMIERFKEEYRAIKVIGRRSLKSSSPSPRSIQRRVVQAKKIGRKAQELGREVIARPAPNDPGFPAGLSRWLCWLL